jgi:hypothetical protein
MGSRTTETAAAPTTEEAVAADPAIQRAGDPLSPHGILALQRSIGNAAVAALVARRIHGEDVPERPAATGADAWTETEIKAIQRELKRLGLYSYTIDGDRGPKTNAGLTAAFDSEAWKSMGATEAHEKLKAAKKPDDPGGTRLNYGELFKDGVLDVTFGVGYFEGNPPAEETRQVAKAVMDELVTRGYKQDNDTAAEILDKAGRPLSQKSTGQFFVKQNAFSYGPPAGESKQIHAIVRVVFNDVAGGGGGASAAFREGMAVGDAVWYSGHGRYGTGPDFDRNFLQFRIYDPPGQPPVQTIDDYDVLEGVLRPHGNPWTVFRQWVADGRLEVDFSNAGNLRLVTTTPHRSEFGGALMQWALEQQQGGSAVATGAGGELATAAAASGRRYRLLAFAGCRTQDYERSLRATPGFGLRDADVLETTRTVIAGYGAYVFAAFVDSVLGQVTTQRLTQAANRAMREHEPDFSGDPIVVTGRGGPRS